MAPSWVGCRQDGGTGRKAADHTRFGQTHTLLLLGREGKGRGGREGGRGGGREEGREKEGGNGRKRWREKEREEEQG